MHEEGESEGFDESAYQPCTLHKYCVQVKESTQDAV